MTTDRAYAEVERLTRQRARNFAYGIMVLPREKRRAINAWIRTAGPFYGVIDFDHALRDPARPDRLHAAFDSGDHLHPNDAGYAAMAAAVDLCLFAAPGCR